MPVPLRSFLAIASAATFSLLAACASDAPTAARSHQTDAPTLDRAGYDVPGMHRQYGVPQKLGNGMARTYVVLNAKADQAPVEVGVALDERVLDGLPFDQAEHSFILQLPTKSPAPYQFVELDWNPRGHPPIGVYNVPHFDFHFYRTSLVAHDAIVRSAPSDPQFDAKANNVPTGDYVPLNYHVLGGTPAQVAVPKMGVHWLNVTAPELQGLFGNPTGYRPFTKTFIYGSWDGKFTFYEPMVTRAYLISHPDVITTISVPALYPQPGWYPTAYRVSYDAQAKEYLVALTGLVLRP